MNLRRCAHAGDECPLVIATGDIDFWVVRENSQKASNIRSAGAWYAGTDREFVTQQAVFSRQGVDRILEYAYESR